jgi:hypothetical protein
VVRLAVAAVRAGWFLFVVLTLLAMAAAILWRVHRLESHAATRLSPRGSDFAISFVDSELAWAVAAILAPPVLFTAAWLWRRFGAR